MGRGVSVFRDRILTKQFHLSCIRLLAATQCEWSSIQQVLSVFSPRGPSRVKKIAIQCICPSSTAGWEESHQYWFVGFKHLRSSMLPSFISDHVLPQRIHRKKSFCFPACSAVMSLSIMPLELINIRTPQPVRTIFFFLKVWRTKT